MAEQSCGGGGGGAGTRQERRGWWQEIAATRPGGGQPTWWGQRGSRVVVEEEAGSTPWDAHPCEEAEGEAGSRDALREDEPMGRGGGASWSFGSGAFVGAGRRGEDGNVVGEARRCCRRKGENSGGSGRAAVLCALVLAMLAGRCEGASMNAVTPLNGPPTGETALVLTFVV